MSDGIDLRFRRSNQTFGTSLSFENDILSLLNNRGDVLSSVNIDLIKKEELPTANEDNLGVIYLYTGPDDEYKHGYFYECVENSGVYSWENIIVQDSYLKSETYNKTETDTELAKKLNTDGSNTFTGVLKMRASISFKGAIAPSWKGIGIYELNDDDSVSLMASMEKIDGFTPASNNTYNIGVNSRKWKNLYLAGKAYVPTINNGADIAIPTVAGTMARVEDIENKITNCITYIPQDIKLELNNGTLTGKAGSKVYIPNGDFEPLIIPADKTLTYNQNGKAVIWYDSTLNILRTFPQSICFSGDTAPTFGGNYAYWFDTANKKCKFTGNAGSIWTENQSLPLAIVTISNGVISNIDQVFNGFGYAGHHAYKLPNVKGLVAYGRNEDGTLKSFAVASSNVQVYELPNNREDTYMYISRANTFIMGSKVSDGYPKYDANKNWCYCNSTSTDSFLPVVKFATNSSNQVTLFEIKTPFHAVDYNDTDMLVGYQLPNSSNNYTWYRKYASGWVEQGGYVTISLTNNIVANHWVANYPIALKSSKIFYSANAHTGWIYEVSGGVEDITTTNMGGYYKVTGGTIPRNINIAWEVKGMIA